MWIVSGSCDYCKQRCTRDYKSDGTLPTLHTPNVPFIREVVCGPCLEKLSERCDKLFASLLADEEVK